MVKNYFQGENMKKLMLIVSLLFTMNLSAASPLNWDVDVKDSMCYYLGHSWDRYTAPRENTCHNIRKIATSNIGWEATYNKSITSYNHEGNWMWVVVDVFGVPSSEPQVTYKYKTLSAHYYQNIVNKGIINGTRYYFLYQGDKDWGNVESGNILVKRYSTIKTRLYVK